MIIAAVNPKGGVGKTTLAVCLASVAAAQGLRTVLIDADVQGSATKWHQRATRSQVADLPDLLASPSPVPAALLREKVQRYDLALLDCPGRIEGVVLSALAAADRALVPCGQTRFDVDELLVALAMVARAQVQNPNLRAQIILTRLRQRTRLAVRATEQIRALGMPVLRQVISDSVAYQEVDEGQPPRGVAARQVAEVLKEIRRGRGVKDFPEALRAKLLGQATPSASGPPPAEEIPAALTPARAA